MDTKRKRRMMKIIVDIIMMILFLLLMNAYGTGLAFHEIFGLGILVVVGTHLALNAHWIKKTKKHARKKKMAGKQKGMAILGILLAVGFLTIVPTGVLISQVLFPNLLMGNIAALTAVTAVHKVMSWVTLGVLVVHTALHWKYLAVVFKQAFHENRRRGLKTALSVLSAFAAVVIVVYCGLFPAADTGGQVLQTVSSGAAQTVTERQDDVEQQEESVIGIQPQSDAQTDSTQQDNDAIDAGDTAASDVTLEDFLSKMFCTACPKHCSLLSPRCGKSQADIQQATEQYEQQYGIA